MMYKTQPYLLLRVGPCLQSCYPAMLLCNIWAKGACSGIFTVCFSYLTLSFTLWFFLHRHDYCFAGSQWTNTWPSGLASP
jgi:hypothetical protein